MMFEVEVRGRLRTVAVERIGAGTRFRLTLDGRTFTVDAVRAGDLALSILGVPFSGREGRHPVTSVDIQITGGPRPGELLATLDGRTAAVVVNGRRLSRGADSAAHGHGEVSITAPMPGRIVRVLVEPGQQLEAREGVVVVEAMKMENELRTPRAGRVREVTVAAGASVEAGRVLAVIE